MNTVDRFHHELRSLRASHFAERIRVQLRQHPDDHDLRWALTELERTEHLFDSPEPRRAATRVV